MQKCVTQDVRDLVKQRRKLNHRPFSHRLCSVKRAVPGQSCSSSFEVIFSLNAGLHVH